MKKIILFGALGILATTSYSKEVEHQNVIFENPYNIYVGLGLDVDSEYDSTSFKALGLSEKLTKGDTDNVGFETSIEITKNINSNLELGAGLAYQRHADLKTYSYSLNDPDYVYDNYDNKVERFDSIPLYLVAKYNFTEFNNGIKPYIKGHLGYSFNIDKGNVKYSNSYQDVGTVDKAIDNLSADVNIDNGAYFGIGAGLEYNNFYTDIMYKINTAEATYKLDGLNSSKEDFNYSRITLGFGYKFNY